jgi:hypothetical protein
VKPKHYLLVLLNCACTLLYLYLYRQTPTSDSALFMRLADLYKHGVFFDPKGNYFGHQFYSVFLLITVGFIKYNYWIEALIQTLLFSFAALFLTRQLETYFNKDLTGAVLLLFLIPDLHHHNGCMLTESIAMTFVLLSFGMAMKIFNYGATIQRLLFISFILACTLLTRTETALMLLPILYLVYQRIEKKLFRNVSALIVLPVFSLLLTGFLNYKTFGQFRLTSFHGGEVLYAGNNENLDGSFHVFADHRETFIPKEHLAEFDSILALPLQYSYPARSVFYSKLAKEAWKKSASEQLSVIPEKFAKNWLLPASFDIFTADTTKTRGLQLKKLFQKEYFNNAWYAPYKHMVYLLIYWLLLALLIAGLFKMDWRNKFQVSALLLWIIFILFAIPFCALPRWHVPVFPILILAFTPAFLTDKLNKMIARYF